MGYLEKCEQCESIKLSASFGPYGFRVVCISCGLSRDLDDILEPATAAPRAMAVAAG